MLISKVYQQWYEALLSKKGLKYNPKGVIHPHYLLCKSLESINNSEKKFPIRVINNCPDKIEPNVLYTNSPRLEKELSERTNIDNFFQSLPPVSNGSMFLDVGNTPHLFIGVESVFVIVKVRDLKEYVSNYFLLKGILENSTLDNLSVINEIGFVKVNGDSFFVSMFEGNDFEIEILLNKRLDLKPLLLRSACQLEDLFKSNGLFVRNTAPRNMIYGTDKIYLIDYDHVYDIAFTDPSKLWELDLQRRVWFGDIFGDKSIEKIFPVNTYIIDRAQITQADEFEKKFFNKTQITLKEREYLYEQTRLLERYSSYQKISICGHQLGRYISDFWREESEVSLLKFISRYPESLEKVRALLYVSSRIDQELLFYKSYGEYEQNSLVGERILREVLDNPKIPNFSEVIDSYLEVASFEDQYNILNKLRL